MIIKRRLLPFTISVLPYFVIKCNSQLAQTGFLESENRWTNSKLYGPLYLFGKFDDPYNPNDPDKEFKDATVPYSTTEPQINLGKRFPFYGGLYNHTIISRDGNINFGPLIYQQKAHEAGPDQAAKWPRKADPALIAPYLCRQEVRDIRNLPYNDRPNVHYRLVSKSGWNPKGNNNEGRMIGTEAAKDFLKQFKFDLQNGIVGATVFEPDAALVVTWRNTVNPSASDIENAATYQLVWATDAESKTSYVMLNYLELGFQSDDPDGSMFQSVCKAFFNGGNATGSVFVMPGEETKHQPDILAKAIRGPVKGRYYFRVDDVVQRGGCSKKDTGTVSLLIYPDIANMLGGVVVDVNGLCWDHEADIFNLFVSERGQSAAGCTRINRAIARCNLPRVQQWGTKDVYFQKAGAASSKAFVGYITFVPPGIDPNGLEIGSLHRWYENPINQDSKNPIEVTWDLKAFTNPNHDPSQPVKMQNMNEIYRTGLDLLIVGYKEVNDPVAKKVVPKHKILAKIQSFNNNPDRKTEQSGKLSLLTELTNDIWLVPIDEIRRDILSYYVGYFKLVTQRDPEYWTDQALQEPDKLPGLISAPVSLHWLWDLGTGRRNTTIQAAEQLCTSWYNKDGAGDNFIKHTETQAPCPCNGDQAAKDVARFMPHPRCSQKFRNVHCTVTLGSSDCYMSAENVHHYTPPGQRIKPISTHYGQVCCYDKNNYLMHTSYQPVIQTEKAPYNPGFPLRANEFGTEPYYGQFEVPVLSSLYHDTMPYFFCCKWTKNRCQFFYWRRPSSGCQEYKPPALGLVTGAGHIVSLDGKKFTFNEPGIFTLLHIPADPKIGRAEVNIQIRLERYPNRTSSISDQKNAPIQEKIVDPSVGTVLTGVALKEENSDIVQVLLRKDARRFKYRTNIIVDGKLRYFDEMWFQRFKGILIYVSIVKGMQAEVYVVMEKPQIGLRIRESFAEDIKNPYGEIETRGILDLEITTAPKYVQEWGAEATKVGQDEVSGLIYPRTNALPNPIDLIKRYKVLGFSKTQTPIEEKWNNLFVLQGTYSSAEDPWDTNLLIKGPVYKYAGQEDETQGFQMLTDQEIELIIEACGSGKLMTGIKGYRCTKEINRQAVNSICGSDPVCRYDFVTLYQSHIAAGSKLHYQTFMEQKQHSSVHYNSCAPMNIEYPEYLKMDGPTEPKYLEGNSIQFKCFSSHWLKGTEGYTCRKEMLSNREAVMRWNYGSQPWCRSRARDRLYKFMAAIFGICLILLTFFAIFICCWFCKKSHQKKIQKRSTDKGNSYVLTETRHPNGKPTSLIPEPKKKNTEEKEDNKKSNEVKFYSVEDLLNEDVRPNEYVYSEPTNEPRVRVVSSV